MKRERKLRILTPEDLASKKYVVATPEQVEESLGVLEEPEPVTVLIDEEKNLIITFWVKEPTLKATQIMMSTFVDVGSKKEGEKLRFRLREYYKKAYKTWCPKQEPRTPYKKLQYFTYQFNDIMSQLFPNPMELFAGSVVGISEEEEKNSETP